MKRLRTGAVLLAYKQEEYMAYCLRSLAPHVHEIAVMFSERPWVASNADARDQFVGLDRTREILQELAPKLPNVSVIEGVWDSEPQARNAGLEHLRGRGVAICLIVDPDEIYPDGVLPTLLSHVQQRHEPGSVYFCRYLTCYRRFDYVVESNHRTAAAVHLNESTCFDQRPRRPTGPRRDLPEDIFFWHLGYVLSDQRMWEKINTFCHAHELLDGWFEEKWLNWTPQTRDLFRKHPASRWPCTIRIDPNTLPHVLHRHPYFPHGPAGSTL